VNNKQKKVLITGGAGFIGSHLAEALINMGFQVRVLDNLSTGVISNLDAIKDSPLFEFIYGDIREIDAVRAAVLGVDTIYHLAAAVGVRLIILDPIRTIETNVHGTENILKVAHPNIRMILASTSEAYGKNDNITFSENADSLIGPSINSRWSYAVSKLVDEFLALAYWKKNKVKVTIVRLFNTVGPRQIGHYGMVVPRFITQALANNPITVYDDGNQTRCFTHVSDVVTALIKLVECEEAIGQVVNIGSKNRISIKDLAEKIRQMTGSSSKIDFIPYSEAYESGFEDIRDRTPDTSKLKSLTGFSPKIGLEELLTSVINYHKANFGVPLTGELKKERV
jgi:UDP-glucose 4-epimerase